MASNLDVLAGDLLVKSYLAAVQKYKQYHQSPGAEECRTAPADATCDAQEVTDPAPPTINTTTTVTGSSSSSSSRSKRNSLQPELAAAISVPVTDSSACYRRALASPTDLGASAASRGGPWLSPPPSLAPRPPCATREPAGVPAGVPAQQPAAAASPLLPGSGRSAPAPPPPESALPKHHQHAGGGPACRAAAAGAAVGSAAMDGGRHGSRPVTAVAAAWQGGRRTDTLSPPAGMPSRPPPRGACGLARGSVATLEAHPPRDAHSQSQPRPQPQQRQQTPREASRRPPPPLPPPPPPPPPTLPAVLLELAASPGAHSSSCWAATQGSGGCEWQPQWQPQWQWPPERAWWEQPRRDAEAWTSGGQVRSQQHSCYWPYATACWQ